MRNILWYYIAMRIEDTRRNDLSPAAHALTKAIIEACPLPARAQEYGTVVVKAALSQADINTAEDYLRVVYNNNRAFTALTPTHNGYVAYSFDSAIAAPGDTASA